MTASPCQPTYQNRYCTGVNTKNDQKSVRWSARAGAIRLTYSRNASNEMNANSSMDPPGPIMNDSAKMQIMIHQERMRAFRFSTVAFPLSDFTRGARVKPPSVE